MGQPTVILANTIKGWTLGKDFEARNATHQMKKLTEDELKDFRDRLHLPITDAELEQPTCRRTTTPARTPRKSSTCSSGAAPSAASCPARAVRAKPLKLPGRRRLRRAAQGLRAAGESPPPWPSSRCSRKLMQDPEIGQRIVPIIPDEARTFGMDSLFPSSKIYYRLGQLYEPPSTPT